MSWKDDFIKKFAWDQFDDELFNDDYDSSIAQKDLERRVNDFNKENMMAHSQEEAIQMLTQDLENFGFMSNGTDLQVLQEKLNTAPKMQTIFNVLDRATETSVPLTVQWNWNAKHPYCLFLINAHQIR